MTRLRAGRSWVWIPVGARNFVFSTPARTGSRSHSTSGTLSVGQRGRCVALIHNPHLPPRWSMSGVIPPLHFPSVPSRHVTGRLILFINKPESEKYKILYRQHATETHWHSTCRLTRNIASSGIWSRVIGWLAPDVSKDRSTSIFRAMQYSLTALPWSWRQSSSATPEATQPTAQYHVPAYANIRQHRHVNRIYREVWQAEVTKVTTRSHIRTHLTLPSSVISPTSAPSSINLLTL